MTESPSKRQKKLRQAGLIVGLVGVVEIVLFAIAVGEAPFTSFTNFLHALPAALVLSFPFLVMVGIAWQWPLAGGILLIAASLFWPVWRLSTVPTMPPISSIIVFIVLPVSLLPLISGILLLISGRGHHKD
ncbi:MAG: hypothetical protein Q8Q07_02945 [Dehalococcoidales bacterium]|nr:hypothetical protein [Dehalococcoidales bacterium]